MVCLYQQEGLEFSELVGDILKKQFNLSVMRSKEFRIKSETFNPLRDQYEASRIIDSLMDCYDKSCDKHLVIVDVDIYTPRFNFIFGLADVQRKVAIVSIHRLSINGLLKERLAKEVVHEIGHILGLNHCSIPTCVMYFSNTIADTDRKGIDLCEECRRKIEGI
ncbi:MAG: archaemetzincin family Zn-dependent metalloprotease [candidate division WOR-3 bacterium]